MSKQAVQFNVDLTINEGKLDAFRGIVQAMIAGTQKEPGALGYEWYLSGDRKRCRIVENYKDADAALAHMTSAGVRELVPKMLEVSSLNRFGGLWRPRTEGGGATRGNRSRDFSVLGRPGAVTARSECRGPFDCFASRNSHSAQDDNLGMEIVS